MDAQTIYRTFRQSAVHLAETHDVPVDEALRALARAASRCPPDLRTFEVARYVRASTEQAILESSSRQFGLRETG